MEDKMKQSKYIIRHEILRLINTPVNRRLLMDALGCTEFTISRYIQKNDDSLTKYAALKVIGEVAGKPFPELVEETFVDK